MDYVKGTNTGIRGILSAAKDLRAIASKVAYVHGHDSRLVNDLEVCADNLEGYADMIQQAIDKDLKDGLQRAQATVGGILSDLLQK